VNQDRNTDGTDDERPLTARSVIASTLLGSDDARLPVGVLVRSGEVFGIAEGTVRTALSRMASAGEVVGEGGAYRLTGRLLDRHARQLESRRPRPGRWRGDWQVAVVVGPARVPAERARLRVALRDLRMGELREGVWMRPDNLPATAAEARAIAGPQCEWLLARPDGDPFVIANRLWDLDGWAAGARQLVGRLEVTRPLLDADRGQADLAEAYLLSAAVLRHLLSDPLLPNALLKHGWPGGELREHYEAFDAAFMRVWRAWLRG
jgi:phenylacetic acid degradation operon negative regulatory protein